MKKFLFAIILSLFLGFPMLVSAGTTVTFGWEYPSPPGDFSHFVLQQKLPDGSWIDVSENISKTSREYTLPDQADGTYTWRLLAFDLSALSSPSNEITDTLEDTSGPPPPPQNFRIVLEVFVEIKDGQVIAQSIDSSVIPFN